MRIVTALGALLFLSACGEKPYAIAFAPFVGTQPLTCAEPFTGIGTTQSSIQLLDFKLYVRGVTLVRANGDKHALTLTQDELWQRDDVSLLDFEDGTGTCNTGSPDTHFTVDGTAPGHGDYERVEFAIGLAPENNHLDAATAPAPFNVPGMWWSWKGGYKYIKLDARTPGNAAYYLHLGAAGCEGTVEDGFTCAAGNQLSVGLDGFDPEESRVVLDVQELWKDVNVDQRIDGVSDFVAGCMSTATDPECPAVFSKLGLSSGAPAQTAFQVRAR